MFPDLYTAYMVKETFRDIYLSCTTYEEAEQMFDSWISDIPDYERFNAMRTTFMQRKEHILNYFIYGETNAFTESINNQIKRIEKAGRGYKFDNLRSRCLLTINKGVNKPFDHKEAIFMKAANKQAYEERIKAFNDAIDDMYHLIERGMLGIAGMKHPNILFDPKFCNTESISLSVRRRCTFVYKDFTEGV